MHKRPDGRAVALACALALLTACSGAGGGDRHGPRPPQDRFVQPDRPTPPDPERPAAPPAAAAPLQAKEPATPQVPLPPPDGDAPASRGFAAGPYLRYLFATLDGRAIVDQDASLGTRVDLGGDLGLDEEEDLIEWGGKIGGWDEDARWWIQVGVLRGDWTHGAVLGTAQTFNNVPFAAGETVKSEFRFDLTQILIHARGVVDAEVMKSDLGIFLGTSILGAEMDLSSSTTGFSTDERARIPLFGGGLSMAAEPLKAVSLAAQIGWYVDIEAESYIPEIDVSRGDLFDLSIAVSVHPVRYAEIEFGYRYLDGFLFTEKDNEFNDFRFDVRGPYLGAGIRF
jgi:hypothetical protein